MDLNHLHLHVLDRVRSQDFYERFFGFSERCYHGDILFLRNRDGFDLALAPAQSVEAFPRWFHFGFRLPSADEVRSLHADMVSKGLDIEALNEFDDFVFFRCADPDGYRLEIYWE